MVKRLAAIFVLAPLFAALGCNGNNLDTSWHVEHHPVSEHNVSKGTIESGEHSWRYMREARLGETLPGGIKANKNDVLWEWRVELSNISDKPVQVKAGFGLVTVDENVILAFSQDPPGEINVAILRPGEKKVFTGRGFIDRKDIPRVARGRGGIGVPGDRKQGTHGKQRKGKETDE